MAIGTWWICTGLIGTREVAMAHLEEECGMFVQKSLPRILRTWSYQEWKKRASSELLLSKNQKKVAKEFIRNRRTFGEVKRIQDPVGKVSVDNRGGLKETIGTFTSSIRFERGYADIAMRLVRRKGGWKFQQFSVRSDMIPVED